jgi:hypothetical protein
MKNTLLFYVFIAKQKRKPAQGGFVLPHLAARVTHQSYFRIRRLWLPEGF